MGSVCRARACKALRNIIHSPPDDKRSRREVKILKYLEIVQAHCEVIREVSISHHFTLVTTIHVELRENHCEVLSK